MGLNLEFEGHGMKLLVLAIVLYGGNGVTAELVFEEAFYAVNVSEGERDVFLVRVQAVATSNISAEVRYVIPAQNYSDKFAVDATTGNVSVREPLDREKAAVIQLTIIATCCLLENATNATILVSVIGVDEFVPAFNTDKAIVFFPQKFVAGQTASLPLAQDKDAPPDNAIEYSVIFSPNEQEWGQYFEVNPSTAVLSTKQECDSSCSQLFQEGHNYTFQFFLTAGAPEATLDKEVSMEVTVVLTYDDPNHNSPVFEKDTYAIGLLRGTEPSSRPLIRVSASDRDTGKNGIIQYSIGHTGPERTQTIFKVNSDSGVITLQNPLDDEKNYTFVVVATDGGAIPKSGQADVIVFITGEIQSTADLPVTYIIAGCLGGVILILLIVTVVLVVRCSRLKKLAAFEHAENGRLVRLLGLSNIHVQSRGNRTQRPEEKFDEIIEPDDPGPYIIPDYEDPPNPVDAGMNADRYWRKNKYNVIGTTVAMTYPDGRIKDYLHPVFVPATRGPRNSPDVDANGIALDYIIPTP